MEWKPLDTDSRYEVSSTGMIRKTEVKKGWQDRDGYIIVRITTPDGDSKNEYLHRLILKTFKPLPDYRGMEVHHIDGDPSNNKVENLEWVTHQENIQKKSKESYQNRPAKVPVVQYDKEGNYIATYPTLKAAGAATGGSPRHIKDVVNGKRKTCAGFVWKNVEGSTTKSSNKHCETESILNDEDMVCSLLKNKAAEIACLD